MGFSGRGGIGARLEFFVSFFRISRIFLVFDVCGFLRVVGDGVGRFYTSLRRNNSEEFFWTEFSFFVL